MKIFKKLLLILFFLISFFPVFSQDEIIIGADKEYLILKTNLRESDNKCSDEVTISFNKSDALVEFIPKTCWTEFGDSYKCVEINTPIDGGKPGYPDYGANIDLFNSNGNREEYRYYKFTNFPAGRIRISYNYHKEWKPAFNPFGACESSDHRNEVTFCKVGANGTIIAGTVYSSTGDRVKKPSGGNASINLYWQSDIDYCTNTLTGMAVRKVGSGQALTWQNISLEDGGKKVVFANGYTISESVMGANQYEVFLKDQYGSVFGPYLKTVNVVAPCANNSQLLVSTAAGNPPEVINGGYPDGGYKFTKDVYHRLTLSLPASEGGVETFWSLYDTYFDGVKIVPFENDVARIDAGGMSYYYQLKKDVGSYNVTAIPKDPAFVSSCPVFPPVKIFVGGGNTNVSTPCFVLLPDDLPKLFPDLKTEWGKTYTLSHFIYSITSSKGIIIKPGGFDGALLQNGAILKLDVITTVSNPDPESPDTLRNWVQQVVYAEDGHIVAESKAFFDNRGRPTQSQYKSLSDTVVLATQVLYDKFDRPAITTLPAPVIAGTRSIVPDECGALSITGQTTFFSYKENFVAAFGGSPYRYVFFDNVGSVNKLNNPVPLDNGTWGTLGRYYSNSNTANASTNPALREDRFKEPFTANTSYPYLRTIYDEDGSGMVKAVTLPGDYHRAGSNKYSVLNIVKVTAADTNIQKYFQMRTAAFPTLSNPANLLDNAYIEKTTDSEGKVTLNYIDGDGKLLLTLYVPTLDRSFNFYDETGALRYTVSPNGVKAFIGDAQNPPVGFNLIDKTTYIYNYKGQIIEQREPDAGITKFMYRKDGSLRFSQNALQLASLKFSYANYDSVGRIIETGEFAPCTGCSLQFNNTALKNILELKGATNDGLLASYGSKSDRLITFYDIPDAASPINQQFVHGAVSYTEKPGISKTWYSYDAQGRIVKTAQQISGWATKTVEYTYDPKGGISSICYQKGQTDQFYHFYKYDSDARLKEVYSSKDSINTQLEAKYKYYLHGPLKRVELGTNAQGNPLQGVDYVYTAQGWLKSINHWDKTKDPGEDANDVFGITYDYFTGDYTKSGTNITSMANNAGSINYYNGIIKSNAWFSKKPASFLLSESPVGYAYAYDSKYQFTSATYGNITGGILTSAGNIYKEDNISYDPNGNIKSLRRYNSSGTATNNFTSYNYYPNTNILSNITGHTDIYYYNQIGRIKSIGNSPLTAKNFTHDAYGMMTSMSNGFTKAMDLIYDDRGDRMQKINYSASSTPEYYTYYINDISGNPLAIYNKNINSTNQNYLLTEIPIYGAERLGTYFPLANRTSYELKDHLGNVRATVSNEGGFKVETFADYYPYGLVSWSGNTYRYGYQGDYSEKDGETGWNAFDLRMYDPLIGRWLGPDPMRQFYSSYIGMGNNPVSGIDPSGGECEDCPKANINGTAQEYHEGIGWTDPEIEVIAQKSRASNMTLGEKFVSPEGWIPGLSEIKKQDYPEWWPEDKKVITGTPPGLIGGIGGSSKVVINSLDDIINGLTRLRVKQGFKYISNLDLKSVYRSLRTNGYDLISKTEKQRVLLNPKTGEELIITKSLKGGYQSYDSIVKKLDQTGKNIRVFFQGL